ncbi:transglycosylase domain-containing protein [Sporosarcina thermotolerans]|uniref:Transglycosylase domain-containing protein n=1 Tax=Sporosarcina thermotolerans TaxID=633404 RepID=A0AAW9AE63_9BACL|nr:transglycosylase domain-containing protein [Sporosarcina thermotolerans]MDW0118504.1 transglycosylase domain-containing protein [Sporosarcina thermotolerans]
MNKKRKNRIDLIEEKFEALKNKGWAKGVRITSGVVWNLFLLFLIFGLTLGVFATSVGAGYFASLVAKEPLRSKTEMRNAIFNYEETSEIYFSNDIYLGKVNSDIERKLTTLKDVSPFVIDAVLATEDEYFETHNGIVPKAIFRGLFQDVTNSSSQTGGSTLTQQLIKNQILTNEVSYERKAKEILLAMRIEHFMDKEEIMEAYLNIIPYGRNAMGQNIAGIETAAEGIFGIPAKNLNLPQAAYIAGIPQAPFAYTPFLSSYYGGGKKNEKNIKPGIDRMKTVLFRMKETGYITEKQYEEAINYDITKDFREKTLRATERYPYLTQEIQERTKDIFAEMLAKKDGIDPERFEEDDKVKGKYKILAEREMRTGGYRIYSTIDKTLYDEMNKVAEEFEYYGFTYTREEKDLSTGEVVLKDDPVQVGAIMLENNTGRILSFVGGRDHQLMALNHATQAFRQNGSSMKPLLVYAPAIEYGVIGAGSPVVDVKFDIKVGNDDWSPSNYYADLENGIIPARKALSESLNLPTARLYNEIIDKRPAEFLKKMNFTKLHAEDYVNYSTSYGGMKIGVSVEENTNAFATFANGGKFIKSYIIDRIEDMNGNIVYQHEVKPVDVFSPETAYIITDMLRDVVKPGGTGQQVPGFMNFNTDLAAKTGTTNGYGDAWLVGYNPNVSLGLWFGYKDHTRKLYTRGTGQMHPTTRTTMLFSRLLNKANEVKPDIIGAGDSFKQPEGVVSKPFCAISGLAPSEACSNAGLIRSDLFNSKVMLPTEPDDSIIDASYVSVKGSRYMSLPSTPSEFIVAGGTGVSQSYIDRMLGSWGGDASKLFPSSSIFSSGVVSGAEFPADDVAPAGVSASIEGSNLVWTESSSNDIIGYYVFQNNTKIATVFDGSANSISVGPGTYHVKAVDITGLLSEASNSITVESPEPPEPPATEPDEDKEDDKTEPTPPPGNDEGDDGDETGNNGNSDNKGNKGNGNNGNNGNKKPPSGNDDDD